MTIGGSGSRVGAAMMQIELSRETATPEATDPAPSSENPNPSERVDMLERSLGIALAEYRRCAEQALLQHLEALEKVEAAHQLEVATLRAENGTLREQLGILNIADPSLFQTVIFGENKATDANVTGSPQSRLRSEKTRTNAGGKTNSRNNFATRMEHGEGKDDRPERMLNTRKARDQTGGTMGSQKPGGSWQQFVAWVPNGAALKAPEPWKPLPQQLPPPGGHTPTAAAVQPTTSQSNNNIPALTGVVPGTVNDNSDDESNSSSSSQGKQTDFEVLDCWKASRQTLDKLRKNQAAGEGESRYTRDQSVGSVDEDEQNVFDEEAPPGCIIHPHSRKRIVWDLCSLLMVVYDMVMIPMGFFNMEENTFLTFMEWTTRLFWTFDMGWSCCTGVVLPDGKVEFSFKYIVKRYLKTWFVLDVFIVGTDWGMMALATSSQVHITRLARSLRVVRVVRLLRLVRMQEIIASITERIQSDKLFFILSVTKLLVFVLAIAHVLGCIWWGIGVANLEGPSWVDQTPYGSAPVSTQYLISLHWSLTQFTGGMDEVTPAHPLERLYVVAVWVFAFMAACIIVSVLTSNLTQLHIIGGSQSRQLATLRKYLNQNHVSSNLALRVIRSAQHAVSGDLTQDAVDMLQVVSEPLKVEMHLNMYGSALRCHPFFCDYLAEGPQVMRRVCHYAMSTLLLAAGDVVFSRGEVLPEPKMYIVWRGTCEYVCGYGLGTPVTEKHWVSEANLWTRWKHRGTLTATNDVKLALMDAKTFQDIVRKYKEVGAFDPKLYAADFVAHMNKAEDLDDLTSLCSR